MRTKNPGGRPPVGPKGGVHLTPEQWAWIDAQGRRSAVVRAIVAAAMEAELAEEKVAA